MISFWIAGDSHLYPLLSSHDFKAALSFARSCSKFSKFPVFSVCPRTARPWAQRYCNEDTMHMKADLAKSRSRWCEWDNWLAILIPRTALSTFSTASLCDGWFVCRKFGKSMFPVVIAYASLGFISLLGKCEQAHLVTFLANLTKNFTVRISYPWILWHPAALKFSACGSACTASSDTGWPLGLVRYAMYIILGNGIIITTSCVWKIS